jgi:RNA polymerase sigma-70 factor (ECF subfamily)
MMHGVAERGQDLCEARTAAAIRAGMSVDPGSGEAGGEAGADSYRARERSGGGGDSAPADEMSLDDWVLATAPRAVAYAWSLLHDRHRAEDVVQDCYCRLIARADDYDLGRDGWKLLLRSISNACINATRRPAFVSLFFPGRGRSGRDVAEIADRSADSPESRTMSEELAGAIAEGLARLPVRQRAALELKSQGHTLNEIAEILETSQTHAGVLVHRARRTMEAFLRPFLGGPSS